MYIKTLTILLTSTLALSSAKALERRQTSICADNTPWPYVLCCSPETPEGSGDDCDFLPNTVTSNFNSYCQQIDKVAKCCALTGVRAESKKMGTDTFYRLFHTSRVQKFLRWNRLASPRIEPAAGGRLSLKSGWTKPGEQTTCTLL